jgi:hypothetical protein
MSPDEILKDFPYLTKEDIIACLSYAADREKRNLKDLKIINKRANDLNQAALDVLNYQNTCASENS